MPSLLNAKSHRHAVRFYKHSNGLCRIVANFLHAGLISHEAGIFIGTSAHLALVDANLRADGLDMDEATRCGDLQLMDAAETLSMFTVDGMPDAGRFRRVITPVLEDASGPDRHRPIRAYGEMVDLLWKRGESASAIRLEGLWNALGNTHAFSLLCGYSLTNTYTNSAVDEICSHHTHVMSVNGEMAVLA
jgi:hypothetical protein